MEIRTPITRLLESAGIPYRLLPHSAPVYTMEAAAAQRGVVFEEMVKSILLYEKGGNRFVMACVSGDDRLNTQQVRRYLPGEWRRLQFASDEQILAITGSERGAVAPLCLPDGVKVVFDESISERSTVNISSGDPLAGVELKAADLVRLAQPVFGKISERPQPGRQPDRG